MRMQKDSGVASDPDPSKQPKKLTVRRAALLKALPLGADRARIRATTAERIMFRCCLAFADWNYERKKKKGWCHVSRKKDPQERAGINRSGEKKESFPPFLASCDHSMH